MEDTNNITTQENSNNHTRNSTPKQDVERRKFRLAITGLIIGALAAVGGVPGILDIWNYYHKSSIRIMFEEKRSIPCFIANSPRQELNGKFVLLLYGVTIIGKGNHKFVAYDVNVSIRVKNVWYKGIRFKPVQRDVPTGKVVWVNVGMKKAGTNQKDDNLISKGDRLAVFWRDFEPGINVGFGEPASFTVAAYFPKTPNDAKNFDNIRIDVQDYLGNTYTEETGTVKLFKPPFDLFLDQSPLKGIRK